MCFSLLWVFTLIVQVLCIGAVIAIAKLLLPWLFGLVGFSLGPLPQIINIIIGLIVAIWVVWLIYDLITCFMGMGHLGYR